MKTFKTQKLPVIRTCMYNTNNNNNNNNNNNISIFYFQCAGATVIRQIQDSTGSIVYKNTSNNKLQTNNNNNNNNNNKYNTFNKGNYITCRKL